MAKPSFLFVMSSLTLQTGLVSVMSANKNVCIEGLGTVPRKKSLRQSQQILQYFPPILTQGHEEASPLVNRVWASSPGRRGHWKCGALLGASRWRSCVFTSHCSIPKHRLMCKDLVSKTLCSFVYFLLPILYPKQPLQICLLSTSLSFDLNLAVTIKSISSILQDRARAPKYQPLSTS